MSDGSFFHITFNTNNVFDGKGFHASYYFVNLLTETDNQNMYSKTTLNQGSASSLSKGSKDQSSKASAAVGDSGSRSSLPSASGSIQALFKLFKLLLVDYLIMSFVNLS